MKNHSSFYQSQSIVLFFLLTLSQITYAGNTFTKISSTGEELSDDAIEWSCVKHNVTGQTWEVKTTANKNDTNTFDDAPNYATQVSSQGLCGFTDWRVPTIKEINSITDKTQYDPAINVSYFPNTINSWL